VTLLIANVVPQGLIFAADRNLSVNGIKVAEETKVVKVGDVVAGYAGRARVGGIPMYEWLRDFLRRRTGAALTDLGPALAAELELAMSAVPRGHRGTIVHIGGFERGSDGRPLPVIWYVRDAEIQGDGSVAFLPKFEARDELKVAGSEPPHFGRATGEDIRRKLNESGSPLPWAGFRQGWDLSVFQVLDQLNWIFSAELIRGIAREQTHTAPSTLDEWERFVRFSILVYAAYFEAFYPDGHRPVGGGVDVVTVAWPESGG
jgi:hypothetical protein